MTASARFLYEALPPKGGWKERLVEEFRQPYMFQLADFLAQQDQQGKIIFPSRENCFNALNATAFESVKVVILGQDPYHGPGQAHGLCFSVRSGVPSPPSLVNIFKEIQSDLNIPPAVHGCLDYWAEQGVLLLNSVLTVEQGKAGAHQGKGWETFTDRIIARLNTEREGVVFLLWGSYAQRKGAMIDRNKHCVLQAPHPSPLSAHRGFFGSKHFSQANKYLEHIGQDPIDWSLPSETQFQ